jgi:hypothetical protein
VVRLGLDPTDFDEGEARLIASLRRMEAAAQRGGRQVTDTVGRDTIAFFRAVENPISGLRRTFEGMVLQTERTRESLRKTGEEGEASGERVARGTSAATAAMRGLGVAGLAAFAAYEALSKTLGAVTDVAGRVFATGIGAGAAGMGITQFGAISQALFAGGNVPQAETQNWLAQYSEMQGQAARGISPGIGFITNLNKLLNQETFTGIDPFRDSPEQIITKLAAQLSAMPEARAYSAGNALGLSRQMVSGLRAEGERLPADIAEQRRRAPTGEDLRAAQRLILAEDKLATAWEKLERDLLLSGIAEGLTRLASWLDTLIAPGSNDPRGFLGRFFGGSRPEYGEGAVVSGGSGGQLSQVVAGGQADQLVDYIIKHEGHSPTGVVNNPGNIKFTGAEGQTDSGVRATDGGTFASYPTPEAGRAAIAAQINRAASGLSTAYGPNPTVSSFLSKYSGGGYSGSDLAIAPPPPTTPPPAGKPSTVHVPDPLDWILGPVDPVAKAPIPAKQAALRSIQMANATNNTSTTHNYGDQHVDITVNAPTREATAIANSVSDQVRQLPPMAGPANTGLA